MDEFIADTVIGSYRRLLPTVGRDDDKDASSTLGHVGHSEGEQALTTDIAVLISCMDRSKETLTQSVDFFLRSCPSLSQKAILVRELCYDLLPEYHERDDMMAALLGAVKSLGRGEGEERRACQARHGLARGVFETELMPHLDRAPHWGSAVSSAHAVMFLLAAEERDTHFYQHLVDLSRDSCLAAQVEVEVTAWAESMVAMPMRVLVVV